MGGPPIQGIVGLPDYKRGPTEETPFALSFGVGAIIHVKIGSASFQVENYNPGLNTEGMLLHLDLLPERREEACMTTAAYQQKSAQYFNRKVKLINFRIGDWVLQKVTLATRDPEEDKLTSTWEGPYRVIGCCQGGAYHLETKDGKKLPRPWNIEHLKKQKKKFPMSVLLRDE